MMMMMGSGLVIPLLSRPTFYLLLTQDSILVLREVTPMDQLLHVRPSLLSLMVNDGE